MMDIEVDPKLFVTCRLCVKEMGQYQITPSIQDKIKYCFDIHVEPFDGLPQLLCGTCKKDLLHVHSLKQTFCEKQEELKKRVLKKESQESHQETSTVPFGDVASLQPQQNTVSSSQQISENDSKKKKKKSKKRKLSIYSSESGDGSDILKSRPKPLKKTSFSDTSSSSVWATNYKKEFVCKMCNSCWSSKTSVMLHIRMHNICKSNYSHIFKKNCCVKLEKIDKKPNLTGQSNKVVHNANKIVQCGNPYYYSVYSKDNADASQTVDDDSFIRSSSHPKIIQSSSDEDDTITHKSISRRRRILSRSSNDTVLIENKSPKIECLSTDDTKSAVESNNQCIAIDSSDSDGDKNNVDTNCRTKQQTEATINDYKIIQGIISMCMQFYQERNDTSDSDVQNTKKEKSLLNTESQLKHKLLSIGRKIINKQGFNCTGLLRYMEHKNLEIIWMTKPDHSSNKGNNYIRILPKLRGNKTADDSKNWVNVSEGSSTPTASVNTLVPLQVAPSDGEMTQENNLNKNIHSEVTPDADSAVLYFTGSTQDSKNILLNASPVANPKQLPKKAPVIKGQVPVNNEQNLCMPIITSTTSLANKSNEETSDKQESLPTEPNTNAEPQAPRIKVKPASELMSDRALFNLLTEQPLSVVASNSNVLQAQTVWPPSNAMNVYIALPPMGQEISAAEVNNLNASYNEAQPSGSNKKDQIILHTVELPNTKTDSPFRYLKNLLQLHNFKLLYQNESLTPDYVCLVKFKVSFNQDNRLCSSPVVLCLTLFSLGSTFCFNVRDSNLEIIDIDKISANWQWEILQMYRKENVVGKILKTAERICQSTHNFAYTMLCLLKSINKG